MPAAITPCRTSPLRPRAVSTAFSASEKPGTAPCPFRSSGTAASPSRRRSPIPSAPIGLPSSRIAAAAPGVSPESASTSSFCPLPATPAIPRISPARTEKRTSFSATSKSPAPFRLRPSTANFSAPGARPSRFEMSLRLPPIIISAIDREVSSAGTQ